jgi:hypothetical protein
MTSKPGHRWPIYSVRFLAVVLLLQVFGQAVLAGGFVSGNVGLLGIHSANAILAVVTSMALILAAVLLLRPGRGPWWPIPVTVVLWLLIATQVALGYARLLGGHIPLGVSIFGFVCALTWWSFAYRPKWIQG